MYTGGAGPSCERHGKSAVQMVRKQPPDDAVLLFFLRQQMSTTVVLILSRLSYVENYARYRTSAVDALSQTPSHVGIGTTNAVGNVHQSYYSCSH